MQDKAHNKARTGGSGLDDVTNGGFLQGNLFMLMGGSGKIRVDIL